MDQIPPPEAAADVLLAPTSRCDVETLLARGALEGGFIISGPRGQGKATLAYQLAATHLSGGDRLGAIDPKVRSLMAAGSHPDILTLQRTENEKTGKLRQEIDVDAVRHVIGRLQTTSTNGRRVVIVDLADDLGRSAANSLLKMLEEPPKGTCLLLLSLAPSRLLPTLISRCRRIPLRPVDDADIAAWLKDQTDLAPTDVERFVGDACGAPGQALRLAVGEGRGALDLADAYLTSVKGGGDILAASKPFALKANEAVADEAVALVLARLARQVTDSAGGTDGPAALRAYDAARRVFAEAGTADRSQTAWMAGLAARQALRRTSA
ncbi:MAG: DNA polymerase III subunit delta' [Pseudomonadota bacterium]